MVTTKNLNDAAPDETANEKLGGTAPKAEFREICQVLRVALTGVTRSLPVFTIMALLGKEETLRRIDLWLDQK